MAEIKAVNAMRRQQARAKKEKKIKEQKKIERRKELEDIMASVARKDLTPYEREKRACVRRGVERELFLKRGKLESPKGAAARLGGEIGRAHV